MQAYRYEDFEKPAMKDFFFRHVFKNIEIANNFHWLVHLDMEYAQENLDKARKEELRNPSMNKEKALADIEGKEKLTEHYKRLY